MDDINVSGNIVLGSTGLSGSTATPLFSSLVLTKGTTSPSTVALKVSGTAQFAAAVSASNWEGLIKSNGGIQKVSGEGISLSSVTMYFNSAQADGPPAIIAFDSSSTGDGSNTAQHAAYSTASLKDSNGFLKPMAGVSASISDLSVYKNGLLQRSGGLHSSTADYFFAPQNGGTQGKIHFQYSASSTDYIIVKFIKK